MSIVARSNVFPAAPNTRLTLVKWVVGLLVPLLIFTLWGGESIINTVIVPANSTVPNDPASLILSAVFAAIFYLTIILLTGYLVAADSGERGLLATWVDILIFIIVPLALVIVIGLVLGLVLGAIIWIIYFLVRARVPFLRLPSPKAQLEHLLSLDGEKQSHIRQLAVAGSFWFATIFALISLGIDLIYFFSGSLQPPLLIWMVARTLLLPVLGYLLGQVAGNFVLRRTISLQKQEALNGGGLASKDELEVLSMTRAREEARDLVPNDMPLQSRGAQRFYLLLLMAFVVFYPTLDPYLFGSGTDGRIAGFNDAGYYVILALGLNIVVGFAGLLDLGYVAFFAIGSYAWGMVGSPQFFFLTGISIPQSVGSWLFWPMLLGAALIAAFWGVVLGAPTLRLRGDYLAIVTLGFGEIIPIVFLELDKYTNGTNGLVGVYPPAFPGADWTTSTPFYYLILALIVFVIFANVRLRDSRLGRAWIAIREDEVAAASSGVNLVRTKLFAFGAGAFFSGLAGAYYSAKLGGVSPDNFSFGDSVIYLAMVVIGGIGSIPGVIVGALTVYAINQFVIAQLDTLAVNPSSFVHPIYTTILHYVPGFTFSNIRNLLFGIILIVVMVFRPEGLIPSARRRRELHVSQDAEVEVGALDVLPGSADFEAEVRVD